MQQAHLSELLREAGDPSCTEERRTQILDELVGDVTVSGYKQLVRDLFEQVCDHDPAQLESQYPAMALMVGEGGKSSTGSGHAAIEWPDTAGAPS